MPICKAETKLFPVVKTTSEGSRTVNNNKKMSEISDVSLKMYAILEKYERLGELLKSLSEFPSEGRAWAGE